MTRIEALLTSENPYVRSAVAGAKAYERKRHLPSLLPLWEHEMADTIENVRYITYRLARKLVILSAQAEERVWAYDINYHQAVISAYVAEMAHRQQRFGD